MSGPGSAEGPDWARVTRKGLRRPGQTVGLVEQGPWGGQARRAGPGGTGRGPEGRGRGPEGQGGARSPPLRQPPGRLWTPDPAGSSHRAVLLDEGFLCHRRRAYILSLLGASTKRPPSTRQGPASGLADNGQQG